MIMRVLRFILSFTVVFVSLSVARADDSFHIRTGSNCLLISAYGSDTSLDCSIENDDGTLFKERLKGVRTGDVVTFKADNLNPLLWTPASPKLYDLTVRYSGKEAKYRIGFRDFTTANGQIFLNGKPLFLRGIAINPPGRGIPDNIEKSRTFAEDYVRFMKSLNVNIIRIPDDSVWYNVCDELGMMVFGGNYGGSVDGNSPPTDYDKAVIWYKNVKFAPIMHHPSLVIYALTNEVPYQGDKAKQWLKFLNHAYKQLKQWDSTRLYIGNAGYGYGQSGDICDLHRYWGWYYSSPFTFLNIRDYERITFPDKVQPLTFTECVGNYTGPDGRYNLTPNHKNPVSQLNWTGHAPQYMQAQLADRHQCFVFKQATELMRRLRRINPESSGVFPFTIMFRNWHTVSAFADMSPKPVAWQARLSYQPVLISWENWQPQVYAGAAVNPVVHIINDSDDFSDLKNVSLTVRLLDKAYVQRVSETFNIPAIPYYDVHSQKVSIQLPENLFEGYYKLEAVLKADSRVVSTNYTELFVAQRASQRTSHYAVKLYDPLQTTVKALNYNQISFELVSRLDALDTGDCLFIGENAADNLLYKQSDALKRLLEQGLKIVIMRQDAEHQRFLKHLLPLKVSFPDMDIDNPAYPPPPRPSRNSFNINPERPQHPLFAGISREELRLWSDYTSWDETQKGFPAIYPVTDGFILDNKQDIDKTALIANYSVGLEGIALAEIFHGKGSVLLSGFDLTRRSGIDPVADRLLTNMARYMAAELPHEQYVMIDAPVLWGEYETEKGVVTGIYNGLMLNSHPALFGSYENLPLVLMDNGSLFAEKNGGWNNAPGKQYVPYGRRLFGPYRHASFGGVPTPHDDSSPGEGFFCCRIPEGKTVMQTLILNPAEASLPVKISINGAKASETTIQPGEYRLIDSPLPNNATTLKVTLSGDRRLALLQTSFK